MTQLRTKNYLKTSLEFRISQYNRQINLVESELTIEEEILKQRQFEHGELTQRVGHLDQIIRAQQKFNKQKEQEIINYTNKIRELRTQLLNLSHKN